MTQRMQTVKKVTDLPEEFKDAISFQISDGNVEAVIVTLGDKTLRITKNGAYTETLKVMVPEPLKEVKKYKITGYINIEDMLPFTEEVFDKESEADERISRIRGNYYNSDLKIVEFSEFKEEDKL